MTARLRELEDPGEISSLASVVLDYARVISDTLAEHHGMDVPPEAIVGNMFDDPSLFLPPKGRCFLAEAPDGALLGTAFLKPLSPGRIELKRLYVRDAARGQGVGRQLLRHAMAAARDMGAKTMFLDTLRALTPAIALYEAEGFVQISPYPEAQVRTMSAVAPYATFMSADL